jgi:hypothetical protein
VRAALDRFLLALVLIHSSPANKCSYWRPGTVNGIGQGHERGTQCVVNAQHDDLCRKNGVSTIGRAPTTYAIIVVDCAKVTPSPLSPADNGAVSRSYERNVARFNSALVSSTIGMTRLFMNAIAPRNTENMSARKKNWSSATCTVKICGSLSD